MDNNLSKIQKRVDISGPKIIYNASHGNKMTGSASVKPALNNCYNLTSGH